MKDSFSRLFWAMVWVIGIPIPLLLVLLVLSSGGCTPSPVQGNSGFKTIKIEACEYIEVNSGFGNCHVYSLTHKGNCSNPIHHHNAEKP